MNCYVSADRDVRTTRVYKEREGNPRSPIHADVFGSGNRRGSRSIARKVQASGKGVTLVDGTRVGNEGERTVRGATSRDRSGSGMRTRGRSFDQ